MPDKRQEISEPVLSQKESAQPHTSPQEDTETLPSATDIARALLQATPQDYNAWREKQGKE